MSFGTVSVCATRSKRISTGCARLSRDLSADELSITVGVQNEQFETAIRVLYDGFTG